MNEEKIKKLKNIISESTLDDRKQLRLVNILSVMNEKELDAIMQALEEDPQIATTLYENYESKKSALLAKDKKQWNQIVDDEISFLKEF